MSGTEKVLRRSQSDRFVAGVCGGLGEFYGIRPFWFRLGFFLLALPGGLPGIIPYVIGWMVIPKE
jgi:phage shock protein C